MKSSLDAILASALVGKKLAKQKLIHENFWGATITDVYASRDPYCEDHAVYVIRVNRSGIVVIGSDDEIELE
jgi:hypothetical protein